MVMNAIRSGGPAYPVPYMEDQCGNVFNQGSDGVSVRDYFAARIMTGFANNMTDARFAELRDGISGGMNEAKVAYLLADAMLKVRYA
jgi:hypothetical protein